MLFRIPVSQLDTDTVRFVDKAGMPFILEFQRRAWALALPLLNRDGTIDEVIAREMGAPDAAVEWLRALMEGER